MQSGCTAAFRADFWSNFGSAIRLPAGVIIALYSGLLVMFQHIKKRNVILKCVYEGPQKSLEFHLRIRIFFVTRSLDGASSKGSRSKDLVWDVRPGNL